MTTVNWDEYAINYNALLYLLPYQQLLEDILVRVRAHKHEYVLDAACGTGSLHALLLTLSGLVHIDGIDASRQMLAIARELHNENRLTYTHANLNGPLPFESARYDVITSVNTLYAVHDPAFVISEFYRTLKQRGSLVLATPKKGFENGLILKAHCTSTKPDEYWLNIHGSKEREVMLLHEALPDPNEARAVMSIAQQAREIASSATYHFYSEHELTQVLTNVGFSVTECSYTYAHQAIHIVAKKEVL